MYSVPISIYLMLLHLLPYIYADDKTCCYCILIIVCKLISFENMYIYTLCYNISNQKEDKYTYIYNNINNSI